MTPRILLTGATGTVGRALTHRLIQDRVPVRLFVRTPEKAASYESATVEIVEGDLSDKASIERALEGVETLFLLTNPGPEQVALQRNAVEAAQEAGVQHIVKVSALGAHPDARIALGRWHSETEQHIRDTDLAYTFLQPHSFMQNLLASAPLIQAQGQFYGVAGDARMSLVDARDVAAVAARVLEAPGDHVGETYVITGPEGITYAEAAEQLGEARGEPVTYVNVPPEAYRQGLVDAGLPTWLADDLTALGTYFATGKAAEVSPVVEDLTGAPGRSFRQFAHDYARAFA